MAVGILLHNISVIGRPCLYSNSYRNIEEPVPLIHAPYSFFPVLRPTVALNNKISAFTTLDTRNILN